MSRQKLGQHFLSNPAWQRRIAHTLPADANAAWLEIGAGHGEMTEFLATRSRRVIAVETDAALASSLRTRFAIAPSVEIVEADILALDLAALVAGRAADDLDKGAAFYPERILRRPAVPHVSPQTGPLGPEANLSSRFRVYGNLPYYITSPILTHLFRYASQIASIHIVIQWEVAARIAATPGRREYAYLSALCQYFAHPEIILRIPPGAFRPPPKVHSALLAMHPPGERAHLNIANDQSFLEFLRHSFAQKRKTLRNNLKPIFADQRIAAALAACKLTASARAEELSIAQFAQLFRLLAAEK